jgi:thiamine-phosphate pyrophosphorylase
MRRRHPALPRLWLLTDERQGDGLWDALRRLPRGSGVVVRHYSLSLKEREALFRRIRHKSPGLILAWSGAAAQAERVHADAVYGADARRTRLPRLHPAHGRAEIVAAERAGAALILLSPVFPTRSHPAARALGPLRVALLARTTRIPVLALGGMTPPRARRVRAAGWAAIDGLA